MVRWQATATWLAAAAALGASGCSQKPDVVATISNASVEPAAGSAGARPGGGGSAGTPSAGRGGSGSGSGGSAGISSGHTGGSSGADGGVDREPPIPTGGSTAMGTGGSAGTRPPCPLEPFYSEVVDFTDIDCLLTPDFSPALSFFMFAWLMPVPPMGETRMPAECEIGGSAIERVYDPSNRNLIVGYRACINLCDAARNWLVKTREANACIEEAFPPDAGTGS